MDVQALKKDNDEYRSLLTVIDVLSKYAWKVPLQDKTGESLVDTFDAVFKKDGRLPERLQTECRKRISKQRVSAVSDIEERASFCHLNYNETRGQIVGRFNRTLKNLMWRYFTYQNGRRYLEALPAFVDSYNKAYHHQWLPASSLKPL